jgi:EmrB/QacA subfamily drug resistance transporter
MTEMTNPQAASAAQARGGNRRRWWALAAASTATFMLLLDFTVVNLALPPIQHDIGASFTDLRWIVDAYAISMAALILVAGSLADRMGHRKVFLFGVGLFAVASLVCGIAGRPVVLNAARAVQGIGAAATLASSVALLGVTFDGRERQLALAIWGAVSGTAVALGPLMGGAIVEYLGWHWIFFINIPISAGLVVLAFISIESSRSVRDGAFDWLGAAVLAIGLGSLVFALLRGNTDGWGSGAIVALLSTATALLAAFAVIEARAAEPILDLKLFGTRAMVGASLAAFALGLTVFASLLYLSLYLQDILRYSPIEAGLRLLPVTLGAFVASLGTLWLSRRFPARLIVAVGLLLCAVAFLAMRGLTVKSTWTACLLGFSLAGAGTGLVNPTVAGMALRVGDLRRAGMASALNSACRLLGIATGVAVLGAVFQGRIEGRLRTLAPELPHEAAEAVSAGLIHPVVEAFPPLLQGSIRYAATDAFIAGLNEIFLVCLAIAGVACIAAALIVRGDVPLPETSAAEAWRSITAEQEV